jgi:hypothetical protein
MTHTRQKSKGRKGGESERFAYLPESVMQSPALASASHTAFRVLAILIVGKSKERNGTQMCSESYAARYGLKSHGTVHRALLELQDRQLIVCTRRVQKLKRFAALYGVTWWPIYYRDGQPLDHPEPVTHAYAQWQLVTPIARVMNIPKGKNRSPLLQGDNTPIAGVVKHSHHPYLTPKTTVHHPCGRGNSKILEGRPSLGGNGRVTSDSGSSSAFEIPSKVRARRAKESKQAIDPDPGLDPPTTPRAESRMVARSRINAIDRRIDVALQRLPEAADTEICLWVQGASIDDVKRRRAAAEKL